MLKTNSFQKQTGSLHLLNPLLEGREENRRERRERKKGERDEREKGRERDERREGQEERRRIHSASHKKSKYYPSPSSDSDPPRMPCFQI